MSRCTGSQTSLASFARVRLHQSYTLIETLTQLRVEALGSSDLSIAVVRPTGIEPVLRVPETLVISFSLRARAKFFIIGPSISQRAVW
jgi:hypothetical protein